MKLERKKRKMRDAARSESTIFTGALNLDGVGWDGVKPGDLEKLCELFPITFVTIWTDDVLLFHKVSRQQSRNQ